MQVTALIVGRKVVPTKPVFTFLTLNTGRVITAPTKECEGQSAVTFEDHKAGETFVAQSDCKKVHTEGDEKGNPLYLKGETVTRLKDFTEIKGYTTVEVWKALN
jgi:hypothetical protein